MKNRVLSFQRVLSSLFRGLAGTILYAIPGLCLILGLALLLISRASLVLGSCLISGSYLILGPVPGLVRRRCATGKEHHRR